MAGRWGRRAGGGRVGVLTRKDGSGGERAGGGGRGGGAKMGVN